MLLFTSGMPKITLISWCSWCPIFFLLIMIFHSYKTLEFRNSDRAGRHVTMDWGVWVQASITSTKGYFSLCSLNWCLAIQGENSKTTKCEASHISPMRGERSQLDLKLTYSPRMQTPEEGTANLLNKVLIPESLVQVCQLCGQLLPLPLIKLF